MTLPVNPSRTIWLVLLAGAACGETAPASFVTEHLDVQPSDSDVVCRGSLDDMESQIVRVAEMLKVDVPFPIPVYYGDSAVAEYCATVADFKVGGCVQGVGEDTHVAAGVGSVYHELVHAVRRANYDLGPRFYEEGIAEVLSGFRPFPYRVELYADEIARGPAALSVAAWSDFEVSDYPVAGHFMSWLLTTYGDEAVVAFLSDARLSSATEEAFLDHFGLGLQEGDAAWRATSQAIYEWGQVCDPLRDLAWNGSVLEFKGRIDCDAPNTLGPGPGLSPSFVSRGTCFPLEAAGQLRIELVAPAGLVELRNTECSAVGGLTAEHYQSKRVKAGEAFERPFAPCTWEIIVSTELARPVDFSVRLTRL